MDFQEQVIAESNERPVLVDFWAPWCGPCQTLGPDLEALESEQDRWKLVKVNVDENTQIATDLGIKGIPDVRLYYKGKMIGKFTGALGRHQVEKWLDHNLPDERLDELSELLDSVETDNEKVGKLKEFVNGNEDFNPGKVALAKLILWTDPKQAAELVKDVHITEKTYFIAESITELSKVMLFESDEDLPIVNHLKSASEAFKNKDLEKGAKSLIEAVTINKEYADELPRKASIALFVLLGADHEVTKNYRKQFDMALY